MGKHSRYWHGQVETTDNFGNSIDDIFIDGATTFGPWAIMSPASFRRYGKGLGTGIGQKYVKQHDGLWLKTEG